MLAKIWKKVGLIILIIACLWNITYKLLTIISFDTVINNIKSRNNRYYGKKSRIKNDKRKW